MAFIPVPNGVQLCFLFGTGGSTWQFCLTLRKSAGPPDDADLITLTGAGSDWWTNTLKPHITGAATLNEVIATNLTVQGGSQYRQNVGTVGTKAGAALPSGTPLCVSQRTALRGRSYRGRCYVSGISETEQNLVNEVNPSYATSIAGSFATLQTTLDGLGFDVVVASRQHNGVVSNPASTHEVIAWVVDSKLDSQRRRLAGRGT